MCDITNWYKDYSSERAMRSLHTVYKQLKLLKLSKTFNTERAPERETARARDTQRQGTAGVCSGPFL